MASLFKWIIYVSSYIPVFVMTFLNNLKTFSLNEVLKTWQLNPLLWTVMLISTTISLFALFFWLLHLKKEAKQTDGYEIENINPQDSEILNFFVTFIIPLVSLHPSSWPSVIMNLLLFLIEGLFFVKNNALYFNVVLIILGYHVYSFGEDNMVITRKRKSEIILDESKASQMGTTNIFYI